MCGHYTFFGRLAVIILAICWNSAAPAQPVGEPNGLIDYCLDDDLARANGLSDLYCINLVAVPSLSEASGFVKLVPTYSPYGVSVTRDGHHEYRLAASIEGLPDPSALGPYATYVAWATTPVLHPMQKLGEVGNGSTELDSVAFNKFLILITAEASPEVAAREGKIVMRGSSPSNRMEAHDLAQTAPLAVFKRATSAHQHSATGDARWTMPPMHPAVMDMPGMGGIVPQVDPFLPGGGRADHSARHHSAERDSVGRSSANHSGDGTAGVSENSAAADPAAAEPSSAEAAAAESASDSAVAAAPDAAAAPESSRALAPAAPPAARAPERAPPAAPRQHVRLADGAAYELESGYVSRTIDGRDLLMYGFNRQHPGPLLDVMQDSEVTVRFTNNTDLPSAIHWHGLRLDVRFDGVPHMTQPPVQPGDSFDYRLVFPDAGMFWFHPHFREDIAMDLGLYANILVRSPREDYFNPVNREEFIMLDDLLLDEDGVVPYGLQSANFMMMGRFGNTFLVNGRTDYELNVPRGETVRFFVTNASSTRTYNLSLSDLRMKLIGSDVGKFEREEWVDNLVIGPAERYVVEARFPEGGTVAIENRVQAINHILGTFFQEVDTLGLIRVGVEPAEPDLGARFGELRVHEDVVSEIDAYRSDFDRPVDHYLTARLEVQDLPAVVQQMMRFDNVYANPVSWSGTMPMMNWATTGEEVRWVLRDDVTGRENMDIDWQFEVGDVVKIRLANERNVFHAMQHPIHIHGQRFLVLKRDGVPVPNLVWKDTMILPAGSTADILLELSNPGEWMVHCHIAEHIDSGMMFVFDVVE